MKAKLFIPSALHFFVDYFSMFVVTLITNNPVYGLLCTVLYDFIAFLIQPLLGALFDNKKSVQTWMTISELIVIVSLFLPLDILKVIGLGFGNALFHIAAGKLVLDKGQKSAPQGVFISFGAIGVALASAFKLDWLFTIILVLFVAVIIINQFMDYSTIKYDFDEEKNVADSFLVVPIILICLGVFFRGFFGSYVVYPWKNGTLTIMLFSLAVFAGKFVGGFIIDKLGRLPTIAISSVISIFAAFFNSNIYISLLGIFGVNLMMALTLDLTRIVAPKNRAFGFGLSAAFLCLGSVVGFCLIQRVPYYFWINIILMVVNAITLIIAILYSKKKGIKL